jgi:hypothetical protein
MLVEDGSMADEEIITFTDLACLFKITPETTLEKFGSTINASIYDAAQISGTLKQKGLIDFTAYYPGPNSMTITDAGKALKDEAEAKSAETLDNLDEEVLVQLSGGKRMPIELQSSLNIRPKDLALRIYKLSKQGLIGYELRNGNVELMLTEQGFLKAKASQAVNAPTATPPQQVAAQGAPAGAAQTNPKGDQPLGMPKKDRGMRTIGIAVAAIVILIIAILALYLTGNLAPVISYIGKTI